MKLRKIIAAAAAVAIPVIGVAGAHAASAEPNTTPAPKASCTWNGATTSDGGTHTETGAGGWSKYKCDNGTWVLVGSCSGNCNPPPPKTNPTNPKGAATLPGVTSAQAVQAR